MYIYCVYTATSCIQNHCHNTQTSDDKSSHYFWQGELKGTNIGHFGLISYWVSTAWFVFDQCLLCLALHKTQDTRRLYTSSRCLK